MENIALACFHFTGQELIPQLMEAADHARKQLVRTKWNAMERAEAEEALAQIESSLRSSAWRSHIETADVTYSIQDLNRQIIQSWSRKYGDRSGLSGEEILRMRRAMSKIVGKQDEKEELDEEVLSEELITVGALDVRRWQESEAKSSTKKRKISEITESSTSLNPLSSPTKKIKAKVSQSQSNQVAAILGQERQDGSSKKESTSKKGKGKSRDLALIDLGHRIPSSLSLSEARINGVSSTKLQFLIDEIRSSSSISIPPSIFPTSTTEIDSESTLTESSSMSSSSTQLPSSSTRPSSSITSATLSSSSSNARPTSSTQPESSSSVLSPASSSQVPISTTSDLPTSSTSSTTQLESSSTSDLTSSTSQIQSTTQQEPSTTSQDLTSSTQQSSRPTSETFHSP